MNWFRKKLKQSDLIVSSQEDQLIESLVIPEPTKSLLWLTDEDISNVSSPFSIKITLSINSDEQKTSVDDGHNFFGEPSLIWTQLPVRKNYKLEDKPFYYPSYTRLSPEQRYQYLMWLKDITQPTNLSYVFLYYYGLERHLLIGNFDGAVGEILKLLKYHNKGTFRLYAQDALVISALYKKRLDILANSSFVFEGLSNEILLIRKLLNKPIEPQEIMKLASQVDFKNKRYIKTYPKQFVEELKILTQSFEMSHGPLLDVVPVESMDYKDTSVFANLSLPTKIRNIKIPQLLSDQRLVRVLNLFLTEAHQNLEKKKKLSNWS